ncbi:hypothetical protein MFIFM68171_07119 [Madurella fahalii]|uniref:Gag protein n=1 Tax=Madurella fahalii TaxID=1157608 RepID=A0ABQ0GGP9_9PEZI
MSHHTTIRFLGSNDPEDPNCDVTCNNDAGAGAGANADTNTDLFDNDGGGEPYSDTYAEQASRTSPEFIYVPLSCWRHLDIAAEQRKHPWDKFLSGLTDPANGLREKWDSLDQDVQARILDFWPRLMSLAKTQWNRKVRDVLNNFHGNRLLHQSPDVEIDSSIVRFIVSSIETAKNAVSNDSVVVPRMPLAGQPPGFTAIFGTGAAGSTADNDAANGPHGALQPDTAGPAMAPTPSGSVARSSLQVVGNTPVVPQTQPEAPGGRKRRMEGSHGFRPRGAPSAVNRPNSQLPLRRAQHLGLPVPPPLPPPPPPPPPTIPPAGAQMTAVLSGYDQLAPAPPIGTVLPLAPTPALATQTGMSWLAQRHLLPLYLFQNPETGSTAYIQLRPWQTLNGV